MKNIDAKRGVSLLLICAFFLMLLPTLQAQITPEKKKKMKDRFDDAFAQNDEGLLTLRFINAEDGSPVNMLDVQIDGIGNFVSDDEGKIRFPETSDNTYEAAIKKEGFVPAIVPFDIVAGTIFQNRISVSPILDMKYMRIALDWGEKPKDLDAHLTKKNGYHISYRQKHSSADGKAMLDRDDMDGEGPETITVEDPGEEDVYTYFVQDFTNRSNVRSNALSASGACVRLWINNKYMGSWTVPQNKTGVKWQVFRIDNGALVEINDIVIE